MRTVMLEVRDRATFIPVLAVKLDPENDGQGYLLRRCGFTTDVVLLVHLTADRATVDSYAWGGRTMPAAHQFIEANIDRLEDGAVVDVEFIMGETKEPKRSERWG